MRVGRQVPETLLDKSFFGIRQRPVIQPLVPVSPAEDRPLCPPAVQRWAG